MWCWPQELKQPLTLMCSPRIDSSSSAPRSSSRIRSSAASPRDDEMPSLQVSVPGQATTSTIVPAPGQIQVGCLQLAVQGRKIGLAHPAENDVLLDRGADRFACVPARDVGQRAQAGPR